MSETRAADNAISALADERDMLAAGLEEQQQMTLHWQEAANANQVWLNLQRAEAAEAENARLRAALEQTAWQQHPFSDNIYYCRVCQVAKGNGHSDDCIVGAALRGEEAGNE